FFFSSRRRHTRFSRDWSSDVCSSDLAERVRSDCRFPRHCNAFICFCLRLFAAVKLLWCIASTVRAQGCKSSLTPHASVREGRNKIGRASSRERVDVPGGAE